MDTYIGTIAMVAFNFAPTGWALCEGQLLPINQNQALFALLGTTYGGDGRTNFALPDLRGRVPVGMALGTLDNLGQTGAMGAPAATPAKFAVPGDHYLSLNFIIALQGLFPPRP